MICKKRNLQILLANLQIVVIYIPFLPTLIIIILKIIKFPSKIIKWMVTITLIETLEIIIFFSYLIQSLIYSLISMYLLDKIQQSPNAIVDILNAVLINVDAILNYKHVLLNVNAFMLNVEICQK